MTIETVYTGGGIWIARTLDDAEPAGAIGGSKEEAIKNLVRKLKN